MNVEDRYGIEVGKPANILILDAKDEFDAIRRMPDCTYIIRNGRIALKTKRAERTINFAGYSRDIDFKMP